MLGKYIAKTAIWFSEFGCQNSSQNFVWCWKSDWSLYCESWISQVNIEVMQSNWMFGMFHMHSHMQKKTKKGNLWFDVDYFDLETTAVIYFIVCGSYLWHDELKS